MKRLPLKLILGISLLPFVLYLVYSYALVDPNLVISKNALFWKFQQQMWQLGYHDRTLSSQIYTVLILAMFGVYGVVLTLLRTGVKLHIHKLFAGIIAFLFVSYNALSHDIFNYMFNARMVLKYNLDPHLHVALEISSDIWIRFMHNVHTVAPYGYGWTALSLLPYSIGFHTYNGTWYAFKLLIVIGFLLLFVVQARLARQLKHTSFHWTRWLFFLNPLVLIEVVSNGHNDIWMMLPFFGALTLAIDLHRKQSISRKLAIFLGSCVLYVFSLSIKYATVVLLPIITVMAGMPLLQKKLAKFFMNYWADLSAILMLAPLVTTRSQQFLPWYLVWSLSFVPFIRSTHLRIALIALSISSMLRYVPFISTGEYSPESFVLERQITWIGGVVAFFVLWLATRLVKRSPVLE